MAAIKGRKHRRGTGGHFELRVRVRPELAEQVAHAAEALGISQAAYVDLLLAHAHEDLGPDGRPSWWTTPVPADQETLPVSA